jgi:hypothetical protein
MLFELLDPTAATLSTVTNRVEKHGDDDVPAVSFGIKIVGANTILDALSATLRPTLYTKPRGQQSIEGVEPTTPNLRCAQIESASIAASFEGWTLNVDHGIDEHDPISFGGCKVDKFKVTPSEGGTVELSLRVGTSDIDAERLGIVGMKLGQQISITLRKPEKAPEGKGDAGKDGKPTLWPFGDKGDANKPATAANDQQRTPEEALAATQP